MYTIELTNTQVGILKAYNLDVTEYNSPIECELISAELLSILVLIKVYDRMYYDGTNIYYALDDGNMLRITDSICTNKVPVKFVNTTPVSKSVLNNIPVLTITPDQEPEFSEHALMIKLPDSMIKFITGNDLFYKDSNVIICGRFALVQGSIYLIVDCPEDYDYTKDGVFTMESDDSECLMTYGKIDIYFKYTDDYAEVTINDTYQYYAQIVGLISTTESS